MNSPNKYTIVEKELPYSPYNILTVEPTDREDISDILFRCINEALAINLETYAEIRCVQLLLEKNVMHIQDCDLETYGREYYLKAVSDSLTILKDYGAQLSDMKKRGHFTDFRIPLNVVQYRGSNEQ